MIHSPSSYAALLRSLWRSFQNLGAAIVLSITMVSCGDVPHNADPATEEKVLHVYGWANYIPEEIVEQFSKETGIDVTYDVFENNESLEAKLLMGGEDYDVVFPSASPFLARQISAKIYQPVNKEAISNYKNLDPQLLEIVGRNDPGNTYSIPFVWGTAGLGYNVNLVEKHLAGLSLPKTWSLLFDPTYAERLAPCGISMNEVPFDSLAAALVSLGLDPNSTDKEVLEKGFKLLATIRPYVRNFQTTRTPEDLLVGNLCLAQTWSGDMLQVQEKAKDLCLSQGKSTEECAPTPIHYFVPDQGGELWCDCMAIPQNAPHPGNAHQFINFILRPKISAKITENLKFASGNKEALDLLPPSIKDNPIIYPPPEVREKLYVEGIVPHNIERWRTRQWLKIKKKSS